MIAAMRRLIRFFTPSIRGEIVLVVAGLTVLPVLSTAVVFVQRMNSLVDERVTWYTEAVVYQVESSINGVVEQSTIISQQMTFWAITQDLLLPGVEEPRVFLPAVIGTQQFASNLTLVFPFLQGVYVVSESGRVFTGNLSTGTSTLADKPWIQDALRAGQGIWLLPPHVPDYGESLVGTDREEVFSYVRAVTVFAGIPRRGVIQMDFRVRYLDELIAAVDLGEGGHLYVVNTDGQVAAATGNQPLAAVLPVGVAYDAIGNGTSRRDGTTIIRRPIQGTDWHLVAVVQSTQLDDDMTRLVRSSRRAMFLIGTAAVIIGLVVASRITRPVKQLLESITRFGAGNLRERLPSFPNPDLALVSTRFNTMAEQIELLMERVVEEERQKDKAEIRALQAQINPHFLYNTLDVIRGIALAHGVHEAGDVAKALAKIFRYSIDRGREAASVGDELSNVESYVTILRHRYGERFDFEVDVSFEVRGTTCPRLILQPIIENAFVHGIEPVDRRGRVVVEGWSENGRAYVRVTDNGQGIPAAVVEEIRNGTHEDPDLTGTLHYGPGIGLANVDRRLRFAYGPEFGITIESELDRGTSVTLMIPIGGEI